MPPTDSAAGHASAPGLAPGTAPGAVHGGSTPGAVRSTTRTTVRTAEPGPRDSDSEDTLDLRLPEDFVALFTETTRTGGLSRDDLLDDVGDWGPVDTPAGAFQLVPVRIDRDLPLINRWMNDPAVAEFWDLAGAESVTEAHLRAQLDGDGRSVPCLGLLEDTPMSYWEIYRADLDPLARHYPARPHDTGVHLLLGGVADRGRGLGRTLLRAVADLILDRRPACGRVVAEPDLRNAPSVAAFLTAGFRFSTEIDLPAKRAALMVRDRPLRDLL
ncbi:GNAT family N-acetyltransferase [Streptomyces tropicalis]|uniref:Lysine N-acyltransferase MbtK n=1 Tax=Streptomyces tropicalis TaxID=3034234 RepID=A0ABT6A0Z7_9ACTN|nr:GNAT family N-acetyltransferase [Streptomyces tropicalis]MDF3298313.1 GNAT family N-acetyltransferase [Streptomyces tropicalis]